MAVLDALPGQAQASRFVDSRLQLRLQLLSFDGGWVGLQPPPVARHSLTLGTIEETLAHIQRGNAEDMDLEPSKLRGAPSTTAPTGGACLRPTVADSFTVLVT